MACRASQIKRQRATKTEMDDCARFFIGYAIEH